MEEKNLKKRFVSNASWQMAQQIYSMILSLIIGSISARYLGPIIMDSLIMENLLYPLWLL